MAKILITDGRIWDGERFFHGDILTENGVVTKIAEHIDCELDPRRDFRFDASGKTVSAGLVDLHMHMRGISDDIYGTQAEMSCFPFGVTAAVDASGIHGDRALLDSFMVKNRVFVCAGFKDNKAVFDDAEEMLVRYGDKAVGIKVYFDASMSEVKDITPLEEVCAWAREKGLLVMVHCSNSPAPMAQILETLAPGDILTHVFHGGENTAADDGFDCIKAAKKRGIIIDAGFAGHVHTDFSVLRKAAEKGIRPDTVSSDITKVSANILGGRYGMTMCMNIAREIGMTEEEIFRAVTSAPAKVLGLENEWGLLREGGPADIAVLEYADEGFDLTDWNGGRLDSAAGWRCVLTVADGLVIYRR